MNFRRKWVTIYKVIVSVMEWNTDLGKSNDDVRYHIRGIVQIV